MTDDDYEFLDMTIVKIDDKIYKAFRFLLISNLGKATVRYLKQIGKLYINECQIHETVSVNEDNSK